MNIIVCVDDRGGMLFCGRRQSQDRVLRQQALLLAAGEGLWMNSYSAGQFRQEGPLVVDGAFLEHAPAGAWCFVENADIRPWADRVETVAVYRWNRAYPGDVAFPFELFENRWQLAGSREFSGNSHDIITEEIYTL